MPYRAFPPPSVDLPRCTSDDVLTLEPREEADDEVRRLVTEYKEACDRYFEIFVPGNLCPMCGSQLSGILGTFAWGIEFGEGHCSRCTWPCRGLHDPRKPDGESIFVQKIPLPLAYHPSVVTFAPAPTIVKSDHPT